MATTGPTGSTNYGVSGSANSPSGNDYGLYGESASGYSIYGNGDGHVVGDWTWTSDETLKTDINDISNATEILASLQPKTYSFITDVENLNLSDRTQYGFIAQEIEEILPELVHNVVRPASFDSLGNVTTEALEYKALRYLDFIAILTAAIQDQSAGLQESEQLLSSQASQLAEVQEQLEAQAAQISALQESLATAIASIEMAKSDMDHCCNGKPAAPIGPASGKVELNQNVPNPFSDQTRIDFSLPQNAHVRLVISDSQGRVLETLLDSQQPAGPHTTTWDGSRYSPGMYYYSLFADGQLLTKKMIKR